MSNTAKAFQNGKAFIPFVTAGDPGLAITKEMVLGMAEAGADLIEIGIPFSDPVAEGPVIQAADERALNGGVTTDAIFEMVEEIRRECAIPLAFMTYLNPIYVYGVKRFLQRCKACKIDALIVPDLPYEEKQELLPDCLANGVDLISLIAPTSEERVKTIAKEAQGFLYCVSSMGVTGVRSEIKTDIGAMVSHVRAVSDIPCAIGFGISTPQQAKEMARHADGVIVGSAIVKLCGQYGTNCIGPVIGFVREMKRAIS